MSCFYFLQELMPNIIKLPNGTVVVDKEKLTRQKGGVARYFNTLIHFGWKYNTKVEDTYIYFSVDKNNNVIGGTYETSTGVGSKVLLLSDKPELSPRYIYTDSTKSRVIKQIKSA